MTVRAVQELADTAAAPMRFSIFSVQDHHPGLPRTVPELYAQVIRQAQLAEALGYDTYFSAEHHFHEYGAVPNPAVMLTAIAQTTKRIRLGSAVAILPFHHPLTVAENYAMVDVLSGGRLVLGVGSGYLRHEFAGYALDPAEKRERFDEALAIVKRALAGEPVSFSSARVTLDKVRINVLPLQKPMPPIYVAVLRREAVYHVGRQGHSIMCVPYASVDRLADVGEMAREFQNGAADGGVPPGDSLWAFHTHVADSDDECRREAAEAFDLYVRTRLYAKQQTYDDILRSGLGLFGSVERVADKLGELHAMGVRHVLALSDFGAMPEALVHRSMRLFAHEVMPRLAARVSRTAAAR